MNYIYSALLLHSAGKPITEDSIRKVVEAAGETVDDAKVKALTSALDGVDIKKVIEKSAVMPVAVASGSGSPAAEKKQEPEEDKEAKAEEAAAGLGALFG